MKCPNCSTVNPHSARFCMHCGYHLVADCPNCGTELPIDARFCYNCGQEQPDRMSVAPGGGAVSRPEPGAGRQEEVAAGEGQRPPARRAPIADRREDTVQLFMPAGLRAKVESARRRKEQVGERRVVTMLFCDTQGSTAAAGQFDPEDWTEIINGAFECMIEPIYRYEGTVARLMGDGLLAFFGAPVAHEDDPQRAVLAALGIIEGVKRYSRHVADQWGIDFNVRVGLNTGLVVVGEVGSDLRMEYTALGDAINLASRMEQTAEPGTVQIAEPTYRLVHRHFEIESLGRIEVKGKDAPVPAFRVLGRKMITVAMRGVTGIQTPMVGREEEVASLEQWLDLLDQGIGGIACVIGDAGLGKTRLLREVQILAHSHAGFGNWYQTSTLSYETNRPYGMFQRLLKRACGATPADSPQTVREKLAALIQRIPRTDHGRVVQVLARLLALDTDGDTAELSGENYRREVVTAMLLFWRNLVGNQPTVLAFDELHWADPASVELLQALLPLTEDLPLLFLCAFRPDRHAPSWAIKTTAESKFPRLYTELHLQPLGSDEIDRLLQNLLRNVELPPALHDHILEKAGGNPFFVEEVVRTLIRQGVVERDEESGQWQVTDAAVASVDVPDSLQSLLLASIDRLDEGSRRTLQLASVIGRSFHLRLLQEMSEAPDRLEEQLASLLQFELIREVARIPDREFVFSQALTQEVAYHSILRGQRRRHHRRAGRALVKLYPERREELAPIVAHHFHEAAEMALALEYDLIAAESAYRLFAIPEALMHYGRALETVRQGQEIPSERLIQLYLRYGRAQELDEAYPRAAETYRQMRAAALAREDAAMELAAMLALAKIQAVPNPVFDPKESQALSRQTLALARELGDREAEALTHWNLQLGLQFTGQPERSVEHGEKALALARQLELDELAADVLNDLAFAYIALNQPGPGLKVLEEAQALYRRQDNLPMLSDNMAGETFLSFLAGDLERSLSAAAGSVRVARSINSDWGEANAHAFAGLTYLETGDVKGALDSIRRGLELSRGTSHPAAVTCLLMLAAVHDAVGQPEEALAQARAAETVAQDGAHAPFRPWAAAMHAYLRARAGQPAAADGAAERQDRPGDGLGIMAPVYLALAAGEAALQSRQWSKAAGVMEDLDTWLQGHQIEIFRGDVYALKARALLAQGEADAGWQALTEAHRRAEEIGSRRSLWFILALMADWQEAQGDSAEAERLRQAARDEVSYIAGHIGQPDMGDSLRRLAAAHGIE